MSSGDLELARQVLAYSIFNGYNKPKLLRSSMMSSWIEYSSLLPNEKTEKDKNKKLKCCYFILLEKDPNPNESQLVGESTTEEGE